jgi:hypothetical protein
MQFLISITVVEIEISSSTSSGSFSKISNSSVIIKLYLDLAISKDLLITILFNQPLNLHLLLNDVFFQKLL